MQADAVVPDMNVCFFSSFSPWRHEEWYTAHKTYINLIMLTPSHALPIWSRLRSQLISAGRDPNWSILIRSGEKTQLPHSTVVSQFPSFQSPQILRTSLWDMTSSTELINSNDTSNHISCLGLYYDRLWWPYRFHEGIRVLRLTTTPEPRDK